MNRSLLRRPSALIPISMSITALGLVLGYAAIFGVARQADEGAVAHLWQLLIAGQLPFAMYFAIKLLPNQPRKGLQVLALQLVAVIAAMFPVWYFHW